jgi:hypothetical protein
MTFWNDSKLNPTRQFRFMINTGSGNWWWASTCSKPSYEVSTEEYKLINNKYKYPGVVTWNDVNISIVDVGDKTKELANSLAESGYNPGGLEEGAQDGLSKEKMKNQAYVGGGDDSQSALQFRIQQLNDAGTPVENWLLVNPFIKSINFGQLDYSSDELVKLELVISYDYAILE